MALHSDWDYQTALGRAQSSVGPYLSLSNAAITDATGKWVTGTHPGGPFERTARGYQKEREPYMYHGPDNWDDWNSNADHVARNEDFADMFMNWTFNSFDQNSAGLARYSWMTTNMSSWINQATH
jgi:hypothetical protein